MIKKLGLDPLQESALNGYFGVAKQTINNHEQK